MNANPFLDRHYLDVRARILDIAATLDRIDRAEPDAGASTPDPRLVQLRRGLEILLQDQPDRASQVQQLFSLEYDAQWRTRFEI
jgi:hypothetical protein